MARTPDSASARRKSGGRGASETVNAEFVQGVARCFAVIEAFGPRARTLTITEAATHTGLTRSVARRYLLTLLKLGFVAQHGARFSLTPKILDLGFSYLSTVDVVSVAQPVMERIVETLHESCSAAVLDGTDIVYVVRVPARRIMSFNLTVGSRLPAHATSMGKVILAYAPPRKVDEYLAQAPLRPLTKHTITNERLFRRALQEARERGWASASSESEIGVNAVSAPIFNHANEVEAALNVAGHSSRLSMRELKTRCLPVLLQGARRISLALGADLDIVDGSLAPRTERRARAGFAGPRGVVASAAGDPRIG